MEQHHDEHIVCGDCGNSFLFSAGEAALFAQRGLTSPKRCKECRRARKERGGQDSGRPRPAPGGFVDGNAHQSAYAGGGPRDGRRPDRRFGPPRPVRYTGDVNEYRSPMQTSAQGNGSAWGNTILGAGRGHQPGVYRSAPSDAQPSSGAAPRRSPKPRPAAEMFPITCNGCGVQSEVPFKPAEGRDVFCQDCYRARKPA